MSTEHRQDLLAKVSTERRDVLKKIAIAAAFATPTIATFSVDGMRKKAFAQAAYDPPEVVSFTAPNEGQAEVLFNQPMNTGVGSDVSRVQTCRETTFSHPAAIDGWNWAWVGNNKQVITFWGNCDFPHQLTVALNQGLCGDKFVGANGLPLVPYTGTIPILVPCNPGN